MPHFYFMIVNGLKWRVVFTNDPNNLIVDGSVRLGVTDRNNLTVYLSDVLTGDMLEKVLLHELTHVWLFSYGYDLDRETEEFISGFVGEYGRELQHQLDICLCDSVQGSNSPLCC